MPDNDAGNERDQTEPAKSASSFAAAAEPDDAGVDLEETPAPEDDKPARMEKPVLTVMKGRQLAYLVLDRKPKSPKHIWIRFDSDHRGLAEVPIKSISLVEVNEG
jgi:hypothetical protein